MHVMQPVVLDSRWSATHSSAADCPSTPSSCVTADVTAVNRTPVSASLSSGLMVNGMTNVADGRPQNVDAASFKTLNQADMCSDPSLVARSVSTHACSTSHPTVESPLKPPKKPLTPYMRFSKAVSLYAFYDLSAEYLFTLEILHSNHRTHFLFVSALPWSVISRLRTYEKFPHVFTRTKRYSSFIQYALNHYQDSITN